MGRYKINAVFQLEKFVGRGRLGDLAAEDDIRKECESMNCTQLAQNKFELLRIW
jgi:hypothetical protein